MGSIFGLSFETKEERERKEKEYANRIFPFGDVQKGKVLDLLCAIFPGASRQQLLLHYILMKEVLAGDGEPDFERAARMTEKKTSIRNTPETLRVFRALLEADLQIDERLEYPSVEELKAN